MTTPGAAVDFTYNLPISNFKKDDYNKFFKRLKNKMDEDTFNQITRTINDAAEIARVERKQVPWIYYIIVWFFVVLGQSTYALLPQGVGQEIEYRGEHDSTLIYYLGILCDVLFLFVCAFGCCPICIDWNDDTRSLKRQNIFENILKLKINAINKRFNDKLILSYNYNPDKPYKQILEIELKTDGKIEIDSDSLYIAGSNYFLDKQIDKFIDLQTDTSANDNSHQNNPLLSGSYCMYRIHCDLLYYYDYIFPEELRGKMDLNAFSAITQTINDIAENVGINIKNKQLKLRKHQRWYALVIIIGGLSFIPLGYFGGPSLPASPLFWTGASIWCVCTYCIAPRFISISVKYAKCQRERNILCVNELNQRIQILNERTKNQIKLSYSSNIPNMLTIALFVDRMEIKNDLLCITKGNNDDFCTVDIREHKLSAPLLPCKKGSINYYDDNYKTIGNDQ